MSGNDVSSDQIFVGKYERAECRFLERFIRPDMVVIDIGAHHGFYTLLTSKKVGRGGMVIAFEPSPRERERLYRHVRLNRCTNVHIEPFAIHGYIGRAKLFLVNGRETSCNSLRRPQVSDPTIPIDIDVTTLDAYHQGHKLEKVDFIKIDAEGAEAEILKGANQFLSMFRPLILCEIDDLRTGPWGYRAVDIYDLLSLKGYKWFSVTENGKLCLCPRTETFHGNLVAVPDSKIGLVSSFV